MSYLVLARKWRPQTFSDLVGQEHVSQTLKNAIDGGRVAHAFLFTGARGVGKTSSARILAKALNCESGLTVEPCNTCSTCLEITEGNSVDVFEIDGASNTGVDDIRELRDNIKYLPSRSRYKIFIIDEVHMLTTNAFNALLKTLEEPPPHVKFIFATTEPHKVPITILSRCQRFDFKRIALPRIVSRLRYIVDQEGVQVSDEALAVVARKGDGSMRDSLSTLDQVLAFCGNQVADADVAALLGVVDRRLIMDGCRAVLSKEVREALQIVAQVDSFGYSMRQFCRELIDQFRNVAILKAVGEPGDLLELSEAELGELRTLADAATGTDLQRHLTLLLKAEAEMAHASFPRLVLEMTMMKMATLAPAVAVQELLSRLDSLESGAPAGPRPARQEGAPRAAAPPVQAPPAARDQHAARPAAPPSAPAPQPPPAPPAASAAPAAADAGSGELWGSFVQFVKGKRPMLGTELEQVYPVQVSRQLLEIGCLNGTFELKRMQDPERVTELKELAKTHFGGTPAVRITVLSEPPKDAPPSLSEKKNLENAERQATLRREAEEHPLVAAAVALFDGEIAEVKEIPGKDVIQS
ncbi:DNA polymerase III, gamma and tau subunits [Citrifermentans bemidjiense Bem]|uniref:DNA polymerase III subunit gamma/tau n=1 Tax=Citrifermentans bemidjiense (strain ATCC BAA-1014 / DSM 16622 / JCM 12645 / Bem) TaxID=404380 RepID=B5E9U5_CITBB|nr:DNA polymerase III subunit gamma/tau [Citrifermentans bemidjiense]ACH37243.1 DNA polymerase III, gamma and tau subunits [Citrifermentans bemidjiense Bem]